MPELKLNHASKRGPWGQRPSERCRLDIDPTRKDTKSNECNKCTTTLILYGCNKGLIYYHSGMFDVYFSRAFHCRPICQVWLGTLCSLAKHVWYNLQSVISNGYSISPKICTRFCCALLCCGYVIVQNEFKWSIYPYSSGLLCWHWGNRQIATVPVK